MEPEYKRAIGLALREKRLWAAGLICALAFTEAWWIIYDWGPENLGERAGNWVRGVGGKGFLEAVAFIAVAIIAFAVLKAFGYLGEMILVRQVADGQNPETPTFNDAFATSRRRYLPFAVTLLPWDALRVAAIYLPSLIIALWDRWDPHYNHVGLYMLVLLLWFVILLAIYILAGITATLAARFSLLEEKGIPEAWQAGWALFREHAGKCVPIWLQAFAADVIFLVIAWPLSALIPWAVGLFAHNIGFAPLRWLVYFITYLVIAAGFVILQTGVQVFKSSLWTIFFRDLTQEEEVASIVPNHVQDNHFE
jgi:hypothetical protein